MIDIKYTSVSTDGSLSLAVGKFPFKISGTKKLVQHIVKILLTTPGTDLWNPGIGGGIRKLVARNVGTDNERVIHSEIAIAIMNTERYLLQEQIGEDNLTDDETLEALDLLRINYIQSENKWYVTIVVKTRSNKSITVTIV